MFNALVDEFPTTVEISGKDYTLKTDFRYALSTMLAFEDPELDAYEKTSVMLQNLYVEIPEDTEQAIEKAQWFLNCGTNNSEEAESRRLFSWGQDANFILAAFSATHGIDLQTAKLHWWRFIALFMDAGQNTTFCSLTALRKRYYAGKCSKAELAMIRDMGSMFYVEQEQELDEEDRQFLEDYKEAKARRDGQRI